MPTLRLKNDNTFFDNIVDLDDFRVLSESEKMSYLLNTASIVKRTSQYLIKSFDKRSTRL